MLWRTSIFVRVVVRCGVNLMIIHFSKHPFRQVAVILFILFYKSSWCKLASFRPPKPQQRPMPSLLYSSFFYMWPPFGRNCRNCSFLLQRISSRCRAGRISPSPGRRSTTTPSPRSPPWAGCSCHSSRFLCPVCFFVFYGIHCL